MILRLSQRRLLHPALLVAALVFAIGCPGEKPGATQGPGDPDPPVAVSSPVQFHDVAARSGIDLVTSCGNEQKDFILETTGSGAAIADYDDDGDLDIYVATAQTTDAWIAGKQPTANALYRNDGNGSFTDVATEAGVDLRAWSAGAYFVDYDNDGDKDLFVTGWGTNHLFRNEGNGRFADVTSSSGLGGDSYWSSSAAFGDLDGDGDLDLYVANYCYYDLADPPFGGAKIPWKGVEVLMGPQGLTGEADQLFRNNGDGTFSDVTREAGIDDYTDPLFGLGVVMSDLDLDGDLDMYVANDSVRNYLWRNDGNLRFTEIGSFAGVATNEDSRDQAGMGTDSGDFDGDGKPDLIVTNFSHDFNTLYRNQGNLNFIDSTFESNFSDSFENLAWGISFVDVDNDGWLDVFAANGHVYPEVDRHPQLNTHFKQTNSLYRNKGDGTFVNVSAGAGPGLAINESTRGVATGDLDGDGDIDIVLTNMEAPPNVLINEGGNRGNWLSVRLVGTRSNKDAIGARLTLSAGGTTQVREVNPFGSYLSQSSYSVHFGLGGVARIDTLTVDWPSGAREEFTGIDAGNFVTITEGAGIGESSPPSASWSVP